MDKVPPPPPPTPKNRPPNQGNRPTGAETIAPTASFVDQEMFRLGPDNPATSVSKYIPQIRIAQEPALPNTRAVLDLDSWNTINNGVEGNYFVGLINYVTNIMYFAPLVNRDLDGKDYPEDKISKIKVAGQPAKPLLHTPVGQRTAEIPSHEQLAIILGQGGKVCFLGFAVRKHQNGLVKISTLISRSQNNNKFVAYRANLTPKDIETLNRRTPSDAAGSPPPAQCYAPSTDGNMSANWARHLIASLFHYFPPR